ncbi:squalene/phytoene synthase family protein [Hyphomicrobium sp. 99]|uniref:squalene/phytoene synthase family protein n=1 Tax=Hyphomicrobium sp. 99 TaxID=1163419 RepID=UPI0005F8243A|nr:squalene/phytoene synthase family protein [Hyphomicrobium sp. 99]
MTNSDTRAIDFDAVRLAARTYAPDRFYAALFAPIEAREDLIALAAFTGEIERISRQVSEAALGEIRVAWWRDSFLSRGESGRSGNPTLDAFAEVVRLRALSLGAIEDYLAAHADDLYGEPPANDAELAKSMRIIDGTPFLFAASILGVTLDEPLIDAAARASGFARIGLELPYALMRGRALLPIARSPNPFGPDEPEDWRPQAAWLASEGRRALAEVRQQIKGKPKAATTAFLPLALVEPYFRALQNPRHEPARDILEIAPIARLWRIARAHWSGRI